MGITLERFVLDSNLQLTYIENRHIVTTLNGVTGFTQSSSSEWACELRPISESDTFPEIRIKGVRLLDLATFGHPSREVARQKVIDAIKGQRLNLGGSIEISAPTYLI